MIRSLLGFLVLTLLWAAGPAHAQILDQDFVPLVLDHSSTVNLADKAQTFRVELEGILNHVDLYGFEVPGSSGPLIVDIRDTVGGAPIENDSNFLARVTIPSGSLSNTTQLFSVDLRAWAVEVAAGELMAIVVRPGPGASYTLAGESQGLYPQGGQFYRQPSAGVLAWESVGPPDLAFRSFVDPLFDDGDNDGVPDDDDLCTDTTADSVPALGLRSGFYADLDGDGAFTIGVNVFFPAQVLPRGFSLIETGGCNCSQIGAIMGLSLQTDNYGCSANVLDRWILLVSLGLLP